MPCPRLRARCITGSDLVFVRSEGSQDFALLAFRDLEKVQGPPEFRSDLIKLCGRDAEIPVGFLKAERCGTGFGGYELEGSNDSDAASTRNDTSRPIQSLLGLSGAFVMGASGFRADRRPDGIGRD